MDIVGKRKIFLVISAFTSAVCILSILFFGFKYSIEFTGGSKLHISSNLNLENKPVGTVAKDLGVKIVDIDHPSEKEMLIRTDTITDAKKNQFLAKLNEKKFNVKEKSFNTLGPVIGIETRNNALKAVGIAVIAITLYIAFAFRKVSKPISSWKFGISAIIALIHDVVIVVGIFSILGVTLGVEIDTLFITAILTIMGFSVHDTIVVFDRIRENLLKNVRDLTFNQVVNQSFNETLARSLNTSITVVIVLFAMLLFGGESVRWFIVAFLIGIIIGTYSSIFIASAVLIEWYDLEKKGYTISKLLKRKK